MIDSSGRKGLQANGTVLDLLPVGQILLVSGLLLVTLFTLIKPEASFGLGFPARVLFWTLHVGLGLGALWVSSCWLASGKRLPSSRLASILVTGFAAVLIAAPGYLLLDAVYSPHIIDNDPDQRAGSMLVSIATEIAELAPWFLVSWLLINLPVLMPSPQLTVRQDDSVEYKGDDESTPIVAETSETLADEKREIPPSDGEANLPEKEAVHSPFLLSLPGIVGTDVVTIASDLHYLNVWTVAGRTTVLGNLRDVAAELGDQGMLVHRSHWVAHAHVRRIVGTANSAACLMSNELRIPVSRRRWKAVREQFGRGVIHASNNDD